MHPKSTPITAIALAAALALGLGLILTPAPGQAFSLGGLFGSRVDKQLVAQVPRDKRGAIDKAEFENAVAGEEGQGQRRCCGAGARHRAHRRRGGQQPGPEGRQPEAPG